MRRLRRRNSEKLTRHHVSLFEGDYSKLDQLFPELGTAAVIRQMVRNVIVRAETLREASVQPANIEVPDDVLQSFDRGQPAQS